MTTTEAGRATEIDDGELLEGGPLVVVQGLDVLREGLGRGRERNRAFEGQTLHRATDALDLGERIIANAYFEVRRSWKRALA